MPGNRVMPTLDVEAVEMKQLSNTGRLNIEELGWDASAKGPEPTDWMDGFRRAKRRPNKTVDDSGYHATRQPVMLAQGDRYYDISAANIKTATTALARKLKGRHMQMISFGAAIGEYLASFQPYRPFSLSLRVADTHTLPRSRPIHRHRHLSIQGWSGKPRSLLHCARYCAILYRAVPLRALCSLPRHWLLLGICYPLY